MILRDLLNRLEYIITIKIIKYIRRVGSDTSIREWATFWIYLVGKEFKLYLIPILIKVKKSV